QERSNIGVFGDRDHRTSGVARHSWLYRASGSRLFWRQRGDNLLEAGVAARRIPERQEFQLAIADGAWRMDGDGQLLTGEIVIANPPGDHRQVLNHERTVDRILLNGKKLDRAAAFA